MLQLLRKKETLKKIMWALALVIIPAFVLWGAGSAVRSRGMPKYAGKLFGRKISFAQYEDSLHAFYNQAILIYGDKFKEVAKTIDLEKQAWERLILLHQAKKEEINVTDEQLISFIQGVNLFQKEGRFDQGRYSTILDYALGISPREFEEQIRQELIIEKLRNKIIDKVELDDDEIRTVYTHENEKAKAHYVLISRQEFEDQIHPSYEEMEDYHLIHKSEFKKPEQVNVEYLALYFDRYLTGITITYEEIEEYYKGAPEEFTKQTEDGEEELKSLEEVKSQIEKMLLEDKIKMILEEKIWQLTDELADPESPFEEVAKNNQLEVKETGFFTLQDVIPDVGLSYEFSNAAFSLEENQISNIIETSKGYFIIKAKEKKAPYLPELEEVKEKVEKALIKQEAWGLAKIKTQTILTQIKEKIEQKNIDFKKASEELALEVKETEEFTRSSYISGIGQSRPFTNAAFELEVSEISEPVTVPGGYCIISLTETHPIDEEKFAEDRQEFAKTLLEKKKNIHYQIWMASLKKKAGLVSNLAKLKKQQN